MITRNQEVQKRDLAFAQRTITRIWQEQPAEQNPYLAENCRCHGYDLLELARERKFPDILFLLFQGELPSRDQAQLLETLMIVLMNPGPRHPATRAAMNAGVGKTDPGHILPIGISILSGDYLGGGEVTAAMKFFRKGMRSSPVAAVTAGTLASDSRMYGPGTLSASIAFITDALAKKKKGLSAEEIVGGHQRRPGSKPLIIGYVRPVASGDERIPALERVAENLCFVRGEHLI